MYINIDKNLLYKPVKSFDCVGYMYISAVKKNYKLIFNAAYIAA